MIQKNIHLIIDEPQFEERLHRLAKRLQTINGWDEEAILNFAMTAFQSYFMPTILALMEIKAEELEEEIIDKK